MKRERVGLWIAVVLTGGCSGDKPGLGPIEPSSAEAAAILEGIRARLPVADLLVPPADPAELWRDGKGLRPSFRAGSSPSLLPSVADGTFRLEDPASRLAVAVSLPGMRAAAARASGGLLVYPEAHPAGGHLIARPSPVGLEDFLYFPRRPPQARLEYRVQLEPAVRGLRLVDDTLEFLDQGGAPRLRVSRPYVVGSDGQRLPGSLAVAGCARDTATTPPWGRAPVAPGAQVCTVVVSWPQSVRYPALLDPGWSYGSSMAYGRSSPGTIVLEDGRILAAAGLGGAGLYRATAELYDPASATWAMTGAMAAGRSKVSVQRLADGRVLALGGLTTGGTRVATTEIYDPATGIWTAAGSMSVPRLGHVSARLADGRVLVAGGENLIISRTAELFDPAAAVWTPAPSMIHTRTGSTGTALPDGRVLVAGGQGTSNATGELFDPSAAGGAGAWTMVPGTMSAGGREDHAAILLPGGRVLLTGGAQGLTPPLSTALFDPTTSSWVPSASMVAAHQQHQMTLLPSGKVLIPGGSQLPGTNVELYDPAAGTFTATGPLINSRHSYGLAVAGGAALIIGGNWASTWYSTVEVYSDLVTPSGATCRLAADCASGFCVDGFCCDSACAGVCDRCNLPGALGTCTPVDERGTINVSCGRYYCAGAGPDCPTSCAGNADCNSSSYCSGGQCLARWALGTPCQPGDPCQVTCEDGVCCNTTGCGGACDRCDLPGSVGTCGPVPAGSAGSPSCAPYVCSGSFAACWTFCSSDTMCASDSYCVTDTQRCTSKNGNGQACTGANACQSGFCVNGKCCSGACTGQCEACDAGGTCQPVVGPPVAGHPSCATDGSVCGGACDGSLRTACGYPGGQTACRPSSCSGGVAIGPATCNGTGACPASSATPCAPYTCGASACRTTCATDGDCTSGYYCSSSACVPRQPRGTACTATNQCQSGFCADGICCDTACGGGSPLDCQACAVAQGAAMDGTCSPVAAGRSCRAAAGPCDAGESCDGSSTACPADGFLSPAVTCRAAVGPCDVAEVCTGGSAACPADALAAAGTLCRAAAGLCDVAETCAGTSPACPADAIRPSGFVCRAAATVCDVAELCNGTAVSCPGNAFVTDGTRCDDGNACTNRDACSAGVCQGRPIGGCH
jgi:hypothetical protein